MRGSRTQKHRFIVLAVLSCLFVFVLLAALNLFSSDGDTSVDQPSTGLRPSHGSQPIADSGVPQKSDHRLDVPPNQISSPAPSHDLALSEPQLIDDDGKTMWSSPTSGHALDLALLPAGCQLFVFLRPAAILSHPEGEKILAAVGPVGNQTVAKLEQQIGLDLRSIDSLLVGLRADRTGSWEATFVIRPIEPGAIEQAFERLEGANVQTYRGKSYRVAGERAYFRDQSSAGDRMMVSSVQEIKEILADRGNPPPLRRDMERLLAHTDDERHVTMLFAPNYLASDGHTIFSGFADRLEDPLDWFLGDGLTAVALSLHWGEDFFLEVRAAATIDRHPEQVAGRLGERIEQMPEELERFVFRLDVQSYGRRLVARLPEMVRAASRYARHDFEHDHALVRVYLPIAAGHNLLMAGELIMLEPLREGRRETPGQP